MSLKGANFRHVGCEIKSKQSVSFGIIFQDNMLLGQLPKRLVIACVDSDALNGAIGKNPFDFKHYNINFVL
jgi:hypothetical protein